MGSPNPDFRRDADVTPSQSRHQKTLTSQRRLLRLSPIRAMVRLPRFAYPLYDHSQAFRGVRFEDDDPHSPRCTARAYCARPFANEKRHSRSSRHDFWTSLAHTNVGSFTWKMAGETAARGLESRALVPPNPGLRAPDVGQHCSTKYFALDSTIWSNWL
jgi:hypothetical protein